MLENNQAGYQTLGWIINKSENGLFLVIAEESIQQEIVEVYRGGMIGVYDYKRYQGGYSFRKLKEWIDAQADTQTFFVVNFQFALQSEQDIDRLNFSRDMLAGLQKNLIFFTTPYGDDQLAGGAYDFYSFIKIRILFQDYAVRKKTDISALPLETENGWQGGEENPEDVKHKLDEAYSLIQKAKEDSDKAKYQESIQLLLRAARICEEILGTEHLETASVYHELAVVYEKMSVYEQAEELCRKSLEIRQKILGENHPDIAACYNILAQIYAGQGKYREAENLLKKAVSICKDLLGEEHPGTVEYCNNLAVIYEKQGKYKDAEILFGQVLSIIEKVLGEKDTNTAACYNNLALAYARQEKYGEAEELFKKALAIREKALGENHPDIAMSYNNLAAAYENQERYAEAETLYQKSISIYKSMSTERNPDIAIAYNNLAGLYDEQGKYREAEELYKNALAIYEKLLGERNLKPHLLIIIWLIYMDDRGRLRKQKNYIRKRFLYEKKCWERITRIP